MVICNPFISRLVQIAPKNLCFLYRDDNIKQVLNSSFRSARTLRSHLVRAKVYPVGERLVGSRKCNEIGCQVCKNVK